MTTYYGIFAAGYTDKQYAPIRSHTLFQTRFSAETHMRSRMTGYDSYYAPWHFEIMEVPWRIREKVFLEMNENVPPPWDLPKVADHFAHISHDDPTQIAFTDNPAHGEADRQTRMRPGRYIRKFYPELSEKQVAYYAEWWAKGERPHVMVEGELLFAKTGAEIVHVYEHGPSSCMQGMDCVKVYAAGDLAVAYVKDANGKIISRALCWPDKKVFGRVYPNITSWRIDGFANQQESIEALEDLTHRLRVGLGWKHTAEYGDQLFNGARILKIRRRGEIVMPYLDHCKLVERDDHFVLSSTRGMSAGQTNGYLEYEEDEDDDPEYDYHCERCEAGLMSADTYSAYTSYSMRSDVTYCEYCHEHHTFRCEATDETFTCEDNDSVEMADGRTVHRGWAEDNAFVSDYNGEWYEGDSIEMHDGDVWTQEQLDAHGFTAPNGENYGKNHWVTAYVDCMAEFINAAIILQNIFIFNETPNLKEAA